MKIKENMHVLLLKGGFGSEREVSLNSAKACSKAIKENGFIVTEVDIAKMNVNKLISLKADVCFNALHGNSGENGSIQGLLNLLKLPYTHSGVAASAIAALTTTVDNTYAKSSDVTALETAVFNDMTGVADWNSSTDYVVGNRVISDKKLFRASDASTNIEPPNASYWVLDTLSSASAVTDLSTTLTTDYITSANTTLLLAQKETAGAAAQALSDAQAYANNNFATSSDLTNLETATFGNLTGLSAYNVSNTYAVDDRVTYGDGANKKIYIAIAASDASNAHAPTVSSYWSEDTVASQAVTNAALGGKETAGAAAQALTSANTYTDNNAASASEFSLLDTAVFEDVVGVNAWANTTNYSVGDRVYYERKIYRVNKSLIPMPSVLPV